MAELPSRRNSITQKAKVYHAKGCTSVYYGTSASKAGLVQEVFCDVEKTGSDERASVTALATAISIGIQEAKDPRTAIERYVEAFKGMKTSLQGTVAGVDGIKRTWGFEDLVSRLLEREQELLDAQQELPGR